MFKILLPTDFSQNARLAIDFVLEHFIQSNIHIMLIHTIKAPHSAAGVLIRIDDLMQQDARLEMDKELEYIQTKRPDVKVETILKQGYLKDWIQQYAQSYNVNLIAMGTKGENDLSSKLMGSVTESVIRTSKVPVLAIPKLDEYHEIRSIAIATPELELENESYLVELFNVINMSHPNINAIRVVKKHDSESPRGISLAGKSVNVDLVENESVVDGLNAYIDYHKPDILIIFHKRNSMFDYFFNRSITKNICARTSVPLLVIPSS